MLRENMVAFEDRADSKPASPFPAGLPNVGFADSRSPVASNGAETGGPFLEPVPIAEEHLSNLRDAMNKLAEISRRKTDLYKRRLRERAADPAYRQKHLEELKVMSLRHFEAKAKAAGEHGIGDKAKHAKCPPQRPVEQERFPNAAQFGPQFQGTSTCRPLLSVPVASSPSVQQACLNEPLNNGGSRIGQGQPTVDLNSFASDLNMSQHVLADIFSKWPPRFDDAMCSKFFQDFERGDPSAHDLAGPSGAPMCKSNDNHLLQATSQTQVKTEIADYEYNRCFAPVAPPSTAFHLQCCKQDPLFFEVAPPNVSWPPVARANCAYPTANYRHLVPSFHYAPCAQSNAPFRLTNSTVAVPVPPAPVGGNLAQPRHCLNGRYF